MIPFCFRYVSFIKVLPFKLHISSINLSYLLTACPNLFTCTLCLFHFLTAIVKYSKLIYFDYVVENKSFISHCLHVELNFIPNLFYI